jgi:hypothetical protein
MSRIDFEAFLKFASSLGGQTIRTRAGNSSFVVEVDGDALVFTPASTRGPRRQRRAVLERVLRQFEQTGSLKTTDYTKLTVNSSYNLTLIDAYLRSSRAP